MTRKWPSISLLAEKCGQMFRDYQQGHSIAGYEFTQEKIRMVQTAQMGFRKTGRGKSHFGRRNRSIDARASAEVARNHVRSMSLNQVNSAYNTIDDSVAPEEVS